MNSFSVLQSKKRIGLFGGTFDPIHLGHLILAQTAYEELALDHLIFIPAKISPYKKDHPPAASAQDRLAMIQLAIQERTSWSVDDRELLRAGDSFAIDTVREFQKEYPATEFIYLIGEDQLARLDGWKESEELQKLVSFAVLTRNIPATSLKGAPYRFLIHRCIDISSTEIRERLAKSKSVDYLVPTPVLHYLEKKYLYQI